MKLEGSKGDVIGATLLLLGIVWFSYMAIGKSSDRVMEDYYVYIGGAKVLAVGGNPYDREQMRAELNWPEAEELGMQVTLPGVFIPLLPLSTLDNIAGERIWWFINFLSMLAIIYLAIKLANIPSQFRWLSAMGGCFLLMGPFHSLLWLGNTDAVALAFSMAALYVLVEKPNGGAAWRIVIPAILLGLGLTFKIHSAGLFAIYLFFRGHRAVGLSSIVIWISLNIIAAIWCQMNDPAWFDTWMTTAASTENNYNKVVFENAHLKTLTHLKVGIYTILEGSKLSGILAIGLCAAAYVRTVLSIPDRNLTAVEKRERVLRELAVISVVSALIVYHRFPGAIIHVFTIIWIFHCLSNGKYLTSTWLLGLLSLSFLVNGQVAYAVVLAKGIIPSFIANTILGDWFLSIHFVWVQMLFLIILMKHQLNHSQFSIIPIRKLSLRFRQQGSTL